MSKPKDISDYKFHPACLEYDLLPEAELAELEQDIKEHGQRDTIKRLNGEIVDGRNRLTCLLKLGLEPRFEELPKGTDAAAYVESVNDRRRHESKEARKKRLDKRVARVAAAREEGKSTRAIADAEGISSSQVRRDMESGAPHGAPENGKPKKVKGRDGKSYPAKKDKAKPKAREELKDKVGNMLPDSCRDAFADTMLPNLIDELKKAENEFSLAPWLAKAKKLVDHYPFVLIIKFVQHAQDALAELQLAIEALEAGLPHAVCPKCNGKGQSANGGCCSSCRGCGHVPVGRYKELTA